jgi:malate synthase
MKSTTLSPRIEVARPATRRQSSILDGDALEFLGQLHAAFEPRRRGLLARRRARQAAIDAGATLDFLAETQEIRDGTWHVAPPPPDLADRRVEITGPTECKMMINALNSDAKVYMADFEDATAPTWPNLLEGQANLRDAVRGTLAHDSPDGRRYEVGPDPATLVVRPRGWHLDERHARVQGGILSGSLFDFGLFAFHNATVLRARGSGPYVYLPKMESHLEARLWNDVFAFTEDRLRLGRNSIRATVLIETLPAAFEMEEILYELRARSPALNAGRWDYLFSAIKTFRNRPGFVLPDRADIPMTTPFLWAYTQLLVKTCHQRGAYAIGGMAAFVPNRKDATRSQIAIGKVRDDKLREAREGFDGTWVAHPDLVPVALDAFAETMGERGNQLDRPHDDVRVGAPELLYMQMPGAAVTEAGLRANVRVSLAYLASWLDGKGSLAIDSLMEDTATAEIARAQVWQWVRQGVVLEDCTTLTPDRVRAFVEQEKARIASDPGFGAGLRSRLDDACRLFETVALGPDFVEFLTGPGCGLIE